MDRPSAPDVRSDGPAPTGRIEDLIVLMAALRTPGTGCAWDLEQSFASLAPYAIEEAHEVADAIARGDREDLKDELGDLLLQVVFNARLAEEEGSFAFADVVAAISAKLIRRHPHVFGAERGASPERVKALWGEIKRAEKAERAARRGPETAAGGLLDAVPRALPAFAEAVKLQDKAAGVGFDWPSAREVIAKLREEIDELEAAVAAGDRAATAEEYGDFAFALANLARHLAFDPEVALKGASAKFRRRFAAIERALAAEGRTPEQSSLEEMDRLWNAAKMAEKPR
jgi:ATP diphosphatase